ncbi:MAG: sodium:solute symporter family protein [Candidatus Marinimicrobia bacterium]|jgi:Na+/proline symporter|nr:sodium:solute symporter family protein [Candidatus Neomarinimicrobiota bacterium]MDP6400374.1 sodium:solute symporter family protein [Candidatus Neomarinimicrobiota bacterium]MDP6821533.1 sodium:solute symporter family protein [Candidatus Neomarinimicrobiota bacterium]MDP7273164.1 sodium:solute symporter family protein [Candidatus Neomarinimicrobiota bacterium]
MESKIYWLFAFVGLYWAYCIFWGIKGARTAKTSADYFVAGRSLGLWVFVLAATATSFSGWTFVGHPGKILTDGLPYAFASFYALTIPFTGVLFLRRQWILGRAFKYITPGEMYSDYYGGNAMRVLTVLVAFLFSVPYLGIQLRASGALFNVLTDGMISVNLGMLLLSAVVVIYVASGGLRSVAYVDCVQAVLLALGIVILGIITVQWVGGWSAFTEGIGNLVKSDLTNGSRLTPAGHSNRVAIPGAIQWVSSGSAAAGGVWTGMMCMTYMFALMGIQSSPAFSMWSYANKTSKAFRWQQVVASSLVIGIILFTFTIFQGLGADLLVLNGVWEQVTEKNLVPKLINLMSESAPWLVGLLAVCALAAMQSTGAAYMSTFSGMITRDIYKHFLNPSASESMQKLAGRIFVVVVAGAALVVAATSTDALVMLGGLAVAYGFQMYPALLGNLYFSGISRRGVVAGLIAGLVAVTLTDKMSSLFPVPWGAYPLTIHSAGWGILFNIIFTVAGSRLFPDDDQTMAKRRKRHEYLREIAGVPDDKKKWIPVAWGLTLFWFLVGFGPFAIVGNTLFSNPNDPLTWAPLGLPSLWVWQFCFLAFGIFVMWFLAFYMGLSQPVSPERVESLARKYFGDSV